MEILIIINKNIIIFFGKNIKILFWKKGQKYMQKIYIQNTHKCIYLYLCICH